MERNSNCLTSKNLQFNTPPPLLPPFNKLRAKSKNIDFDYNVYNTKAASKSKYANNTFSKPLSSTHDETVKVLSNIHSYIC